jgi:hypothetical protein
VVSSWTVWPLAGAFAAPVKGRVDVGIGPSFARALDRL